MYEALEGVIRVDSASRDYSEESCSDSTRNQQRTDVFFALGFAVQKRSIPK